jgi:hypothetical protein
MRQEKTPAGEQRSGLPRLLGPRFRGLFVSHALCLIPRKATFCDGHHTWRSVAHLFLDQRKNGVTVRVVVIWHWLEYDSVAFAVLVAGIGILTLLVLGI